jgi:hypothetical protein
MPLLFRIDMVAVKSRLAKVMIPRYMIRGLPKIGK